MGMKHCYVIAEALSVTHARIRLPLTSVVYGRNAENKPVSHQGVGHDHVRAIFADSACRNVSTR